MQKMKTYKADKFYNLLMRELGGESERKTIKRYWEIKGWTDYIADKIEIVITERFNLKAQREYFRIDLIGWSGNEEWESRQRKNIGYKKYEKDSDIKLNEYNWNLEIAIEYENNPHKWTDEVIKLCHVKCGLKVVIGYAHHEERNKDIEKLNLTANHMKSLKYGCPDINIEEFLIILGNCGRKEAYRNIDDIDFRAYVFNGEVFEPIIKIKTI